MLSQLKGVGWATVASIGLHAGLAWVVLRAPVGAWGDQLIQPDSVAIEIVAPDMPDPTRPMPEPQVEPPPPLPEDQVLPEEAPAAMVERPAGEPNPNAGLETNQTGAINPDAVPSAIQVPEITQEPATREMTEAERRRHLQALLNPTAVARGGFTATGPGPSRTGPPAGLGGTGDTGPTEQDIEARLSQGLRRQAMARAYLARTEPELQRQADGSYAYQGHRFAASIRPDGSVTFNDHGNVQTNGFSTSGSWDLNDLIAGANGADTNFYEREWFMNHTRELRERLEEQHRRTQMGTALRQLRGRLTRVWGTARRTPGARRARIFAIWDEMAESGDGARARRIVIRFIRETIPEGSDDAFTESEVDRLNASRESTEAFAPY